MAHAVVSAPPKGDGAADVAGPFPQGENRLLKRLSADELARLQHELKIVPLTTGSVLHRPGASIEHVYFPLAGMVSMLTVMRSGEAIETAIIGNNGVVGASVGNGGSQAAGEAVVQMTGSAWQIPTAKFLEFHRESTPFRMLINRFEHVILLQAQQSAACHALHTVEARLCRWLLQSQDVAGSTRLVLTQEFLSHMMGVRRTSVSLSANALQRSGLIRYSRGRIEILNREGLEDSACECYEVIHGHVENALLPLKSSPN
jgi:CRP-like cAMP-binding protein